jgi:hypothetical protein
MVSQLVGGETNVQVQIYETQIFEVAPNERIGRRKEIGRK